MINSNNNMLCSKSYLNICMKHKCVFMNFKLVPQEMGSFNILARALNNLKLKYFTHFHSRILYIIQ